jgi:DMSO/TMAO reductase YedYZ molybdopterin-dependent catalytic subunit
MKRPSLFLGALLGGLNSFPVIALAYLGEQWAGLPFFPFDLFDWLARVLPGRLITLVIDTMVQFITLLGLGPISNTAKLIEQLQGILLVIAGGIVLGLVIAWVMRIKNWSGFNVGLVVGLVGFALLAAIELSLGNAIVFNPVVALLWLALLIGGWGALLGVLLSAPEAATITPPLTTEFRAARRNFLLKFAGGSVGVALAAWGVGRLLSAQEEATGAGQALAQLKLTPPPTPGSAPATPGSIATPTLSGATPQPSSTPPIETTSTPLPATAALTREPVVPAPGTRPELTPNKDFYRIDINTRPPVIKETDWTLEVSGLFDRPRPLTLSDLVAYPAVTQPITISCISNPIGGDLISTSNWTGVPLRVVLKDLGLRREAEELYIKAADGFYESVAMEDMMDPRTLLVYGMNGETLPVEHGFPLRIYIPNRYGMKQPKWITSIEAIDHHGPGYWVDRNWNPEARPHIISIIDTVATDHVENGRVPVGGIAWAGDRGIRKVEVRVDEGDWAEANLRTPPLSPLTWVQWRYDWPAVAGRHTFRVRATDGTGMLQIGAEQDSYPDGATGYDQVTVTV